MGQGNQVRGLIISSKLKGWDPTKIIGGVDRDPTANGIGDQERTGTGRFSDAPDPQASPPGETTTRSIPADERGMARKPTVNGRWDEGMPGAR